MSASWDLYDRENLSDHILYPVALRGKIQKPNRISWLRILTMGSSA